jgi:molybdopterin-containing oxidoreductase family iron-sulfur binding subunit
MCNHCERPSCVRVCPTQATWKRKDGIVMMDQHRCIGCRYCMAACPYGSRSFNFVDPRPTLQKSGINPGYPTRTRGVVEKCSFCAERLARGKLPACVEACPVKALVFGDLNDPESEVARLLEEKYTIRRKPGLGTNPHVFYLV